MGHERIGILPKTKPWLDVVSQLLSFSQSEISIDLIAAQTLRNVKNKFDNIQNDTGVKAAFQFLVLLSVASKQKNPAQYLSNKGIELNSKSTPLQIGKAINEWVSNSIQSNEYGALAKSAAIDAISSWYAQHKISQSNLFENFPSTFEVFREAANGSGFCELSRLYFSKFTERYLKYFLEREASSNISNLEKRNQFGAELQNHVRDISLHAFETAKITQSFAAGWFNKYAKQDAPSESKMRAFLSLAFGKLRDELLREESK